MIVTVKADITWEGRNKTFANQREKFFKKMLKQLCDAQDVDIISVDAWDEDSDADGLEGKEE